MTTHAQQGWPCPSCSGKGQTFAHQNLGDRPHRIGWVPCLTCRGAGTITDDHALRIQDGHQLRMQRKAERKTLRQAAEERGISVVEYSELENPKARP